MVDARRFERASRSRDKPVAFCFGKEMLRQDTQRSESAQVPLDVGLGRVPVSNSDSSDGPTALTHSEEPLAFGSSTPRIRFDRGTLDVHSVTSGLYMQYARTVCGGAGSRPWRRRRHQVCPPCLGRNPTRQPGRCNGVLCSRSGLGIGLVLAEIPASGAFDT